MQFGKSVGIACSTFADLFILVTFFAEATTSANLSPLKITIGQYLGFTIIVIISIIGFSVSLTLSSKPIGFLGLLPILLGVWKLLEVIFPTKEEEKAAKAKIAGMKSIFKVSVITLINGGDIIGIYLPLFSQSRGAEIVIYVVIYYILLGVWCFAAWLLMRQKRVLRLVEKYMNWVIPFFYMGLGIYITVKSDCYPWSIEHINNHLGNLGKTIMAIVSATALLAAIGAMLWFKLRKRAQQLSQQRQQRDIPVQELTQLLHSPDHPSATDSMPQPTDDRGRNTDFLDEIEVRVGALIQESAIDVEAIESEFKRATVESKEAYKGVLLWRSVEYSNCFRESLGRLLGSLAVKKGILRAKIFHLAFKEAERMFGRLATTEYIDSSRADHLYEIAHKEAFPPGYPYHPLEPQQFRYLELLPNESLSATPQCRLYRGKPADCDYAALSYVWGQRDTQNPVFIELESQPFDVTPNLFSALRHLRHPTHKITLWVDAVCINQNDVSERTKQVNLMTAIYESASSVLMWLGPQKDASNTAMRFLVEYDNGIAEGTSS
jgi:cadmium resistance protein CadD (predicted permease)